MMNCARISLVELGQRATVSQPRLARSSAWSSGSTRRWLSGTCVRGSKVPKGAGQPFDAPFLSASHSGLTESQMDVREAIRAVTSQFANEYWRLCDKEYRCEFWVDEG